MRAGLLAKARAAAAPYLRSQSNISGDGAHPRSTPATIAAGAKSDAHMIGAAKEYHAAVAARLDAKAKEHHAMRDASLQHQHQQHQHQQQQRHHQQQQHQQQQQQRLEFQVGILRTRRAGAEEFEPEEEKGARMAPLLSDACGTAKVPFGRFSHAAAQELERVKGTRMAHGMAWLIAARAAPKSRVNACRLPSSAGHGGRGCTQARSMDGLALALDVLVEEGLLELWSLS
jgi:hypothetical protein